MSWSGNGRYWGPRPAGPSTAEASGWWDSRSQFGAKRSNVWPLANLRLLSMGFGSGLLDDSSYSRAVGTSGTVTWASGQHATVSADSGFTLGASQSLELAGDFTIEAWFNLPALGTFRIFAAPAAGGQEIFQCAVVAAGTVLFSSTGTGGNRTMTASGYPLVTANAWHHLAFVRSGGEIRAYLNGQWLGVSVTGITGTLLQGQSLAFPRLGVSFGNVAGSLDDVIVSAAALYTSNFTPPGRSAP